MRSFLALLLILSTIHVAIQDQEAEEVFYTLAKTFGGKLDGVTGRDNQYGMLYVEFQKLPMARTNGEIFLEYDKRSLERAHGRNRKCYPMKNIGDDIFANYAVTIPQPYGRINKMHTERQLLEVVYEDMKRWKRSAKKTTIAIGRVTHSIPYSTSPREALWSNPYRATPEIIYLYTYFLPCGRCSDYILEFIRNEKKPIIIGYSSTYFNEHECHCYDQAHRGNRVKCPKNAWEDCRDQFENVLAGHGGESKLVYVSQLNKFPIHTLVDEYEARARNSISPSTKRRKFGHL